MSAAQVGAALASLERLSTRALDREGRVQGPRTNEALKPTLHGGAPPHDSGDDSRGSDTFESERRMNAAEG